MDGSLGCRDGCEGRGPMKLLIAPVASVLLGLFSAVSAQGPVSVEALGWLSGCWASIGGETGSGERWTVPAGQTLLGVSRTVQDSQTVEYEFLQIRETEAGEIEYIARPSGQAGSLCTVTRRIQSSWMRPRERSL